MGVNGCDGTQGTREDTKTRQAETKMVVQAVSWTLWSGKFPRTSCFTKKRENVRLTLDGCAWVRMGVVGCMHTEGSKNERKRGTDG